jgi:hypothetical protein
MLLEDAGALTDLGHGRIPVAALTDRELDCVFGLRGSAAKQRERRKRGNERPHSKSSPILLSLYCA